MKKLSLITVLLFIFSLSIYALDMNSKKIFEKPLDETSTEFKEIEQALSSSAMKALFTQTKSVPRFKRNLISSGTMLLQAGIGMAWLTEKPYESIMVVTKDSMKQRVAGGKVIAQNVEGNTVYLAIAEAMENVFSGRFSLIHDVFTPYFTKEDDKWYIGLVPKNDDFSSFVSFITLSGNKYIEKVFMQEKGGNTILYEFNNVFLGELNETEKRVFAL